MTVRCGDRTIIQILTTFVFHGGKLSDDYGRHLIELIIVVHLINNCVSIDCVLEKRCVKFVWNLFNGENVLFRRIIRYSMHNSDTTIGENVRNFMYKYKIVYDDWFNDLSNIFNRIYNQIKNTTQLDDICLASAIRELCEARDRGFVQFVDRNQLCNMIDMLCTR